jgi:Dolichyl-phosphate-mannose-protein mannosyltransferase/RTX calcium-binding nonapeptide repeat (4 copies)
MAGSMRFSRQRGARVQINPLMAGGTLLAITALALFLRLHLLGQNSFWGDELASVRRAQLDWQSFWELISGAPAMTLYYVVLRFWILLGDSEFTVRILSVIPAVVTLPLIYLLGKHLFDAKIGVIAALLLAVNAFHIQYSQEARSYSLLVFLVTLSSLFLIRAIERPLSGVNWAGYIGTIALAVFAHPFALLVGVAQVSSLVFLPRQKVPWGKLLASGILIGVALLPILANVVGDLVDPEAAIDSQALAWVPETSLYEIYNFATELTGQGGALLLILYLIPVLIAGITALRTWASTRASFESWKYALLLTWLFLPIIITLAYSFLIAPALVPRYLIISLPPLLILTAAGVWQIYRSLSVRHGPLGMSILLVSGVLAAGLVALSVRGISAYYTDFVKEDWRGAAALIMSEWQPGDGILFYVPSTERMIQHYFERAQPGAPKIRSLVPNGYPEKSPYIGQWHQFLLQEPNGERIAQYLPDHVERIWLVVARNRGSATRATITNELRAALSSKYQDAERWHSADNLVNVDRYSTPIPGVFGGQWEEVWRQIQLSQVTCHKLSVTMVGTDGDDHIIGTEGDNVIHTLDGNDTVNGLGGNDTICGGNGNDTLDGGEGDDTINGNSGDDIVRGGPGNDMLFGATGNDQLFGDTGDDKLAGGPGRDVLNGGVGDDTLSGGDDDDTLNGGVGDDVLNSGSGSNILDGGLGLDLCQGRGTNEDMNCETSEILEQQADSVPTP